MFDPKIEGIAGEVLKEFSNFLRFTEGQLREAPHKMLPPPEQLSRALMELHALVPDIKEPQRAIESNARMQLMQVIARCMSLIIWLEVAKYQFSKEASVSKKDMN